MHARDLLGDAPVLVVNSDNLWIDGPTDAIRELAAGWDDARMDALLLLVPLARANNHRGKGDFRLAADGRITGRRGRNRVAPFVFTRSEEHTSELQSLMRISYAVFCLKKKKQNKKMHQEMTHKNIQTK